jgi:hypothetical protein
MLLMRLRGPAPVFIKKLAGPWSTRVFSPGARRAIGIALDRRKLIADFGIGIGNPCDQP